MKIEFLKKFSKDLDDIKQKSVKHSLINLIELIESIDTLDKIPNTKKLKGHKSEQGLAIIDWGFSLKTQPFF
jgi:mRNA interferase RelE/StbE